MEGLPQSVAAALAGITTRRLQQLQHEEDPPARNPDGSYPPVQYGQWLKRRAVADIHVAEDGTAYNYEAERARLTHEQADKTALENAELRADLVRMTVVESYWAALGASLRAKLVSIPSKLGALVGDVAARAKFTGQAEALVYEALAEIQQDAVPHEIRARASRSRSDDVPWGAAPAAETDSE